MRSLSLRASVGLVFLLVAGGTSARASDAQGTPPPAVVDLAFGDGLGVRELLVETARRTGRTILWNEQDKAITRKIVGAQILRVPAAGLLEAVADLLATQEIVLVPSGAGPTPTLVATDLRSMQNQLLLRLHPTPVTMDDATAARLENRNGLYIQTTLTFASPNDLAQARFAFQRLLTQSIGGVHELRQSVVVTDFAPRVVAAYRFLRSLPPPPDASTSPPTAVVVGDGSRVEFFALKHAVAADVHRALDDLLSTKAPNLPNALPRFSVDAAANLVSMVGYELQIERARVIVERLDVERPKTAAPR